MLSELCLPSLTVVIAVFLYLGHFKKFYDDDDDGKYPHVCFCHDALTGHIVVRMAYVRVSDDQHQQVVVVNQPISTGAMCQPQNVREWSTGICDCFDDCPGCML